MDKVAIKNGIDFTIYVIIGFLWVMLFWGGLEIMGMIDLDSWTEGWRAWVFVLSMLLGPNFIAMSLFYLGLEKKKGVNNGEEIKNENEPAS